MTSSIPNQTTDSPLTEANPLSLQELFNKDPLQLTREDRLAIIERLRAARKDFAEAESKPKATKVPKTKADASLSLDDLGI